MTEAEVEKIVRREIVQILRSLRARLNRDMDHDEVLRRTISQYEEKPDAK